MNDEYGPIVDQSLASVSKGPRISDHLRPFDSNERITVKGKYETDEEPFSDEELESIRTRNYRADELKKREEYKKYFKAINESNSDNYYSMLKNYDR